MTSPTADAVAFYDRFAASLAPAYESVDFAQVHPTLIRFLPKAPARVLDVGAGSGRDARGLARLGHEVTAIEPARAFLELGRRQASGLSVRWVDDRLPGLSSVRSERQLYEFILCSAVLMTLPQRHIGPSFKTMRGLLAVGGKLAVTVRDPIPSDPEGLLHRHSSATILEAGEAAGLKMLREQLLDDALGRPIAWRSFVFERTDRGGLSQEAAADPSRER